MSGTPQQPDNRHSWIFNESGNDRNHQWYYREAHTGSDGSTGYFHIYPDGTRVYVADTPPAIMGGGGAPNSMQNSAGAALAPAPAPTPAAPINSGDTMHAAPANLPAWNAASAPQPASAAPPADPQTGGLQAPVATAAPVVPVAQPVAVTPSVPGTPDTVTVPVQEAVPGTASTGGAVVSPDGNQLDSIASGATEALHSSSLHVGGRLANQLTSLGNDGTYTVVTGDTLSDIAQEHNMSLEQVVALNPQIKDPNLILPGQEIKIGGGLDGAAFPTTSTYDSTIPTTVQAPEDAHKVGVGGWSDGTSAIPNDPTHGIAAVAQVQTDPLKINDNRHNAQT